MDAALSALLRQNAQDLGFFYFVPQKTCQVFFEIYFTEGASSYPQTKVFLFLSMAIPLMLIRLD